MRSKLILLLLFITGTVSAQFDSYTYKRKLAPVSKEGYYSISLRPEVTANSKSNLGDLRIYNISASDTTEIPYLIDRLGDKTEEKSVPFELINDVTQLKCCYYVTLKMSKQRVINRIDLDVAQTNFDTFLDVEGSYDNKEWFTIRKHLRIVGFSNGERIFKSTTINFPSAQYIYFRIGFEDNGSERVKVNSASAFDYKTTKGTYDELKVKSLQQTENKKNKTSEVIAEFPGDYLLDHITLKSGNKNNFYRSINIFKLIGTFHTPKGDEEAWEQVASGVMVSHEENTFDLGNTQAKKLKIEIINYDDRPLKIEEVKAYSERLALVSQLPLCENCYLAYGKENAAAPVYDFVHFKGNIPADLPQLNYGTEELKPVISAAKAEPLMTGKIWLWIAIGAVILVIGYFALSMLKKESE